jgi:glycine betaine/proline transport system substrate-binding protein
MMIGFQKVLAVGLLSCALAGATQAQDKTIKLGTMGWEDLMPITLVTKKVLEDKGYTVEVTNFSEWGIAYGALAKGDIELLTSQINYVAQDYWDKNKEKLEKLSPVSHGLFQGLVVPDYMTIESVADLNSVADELNNQIIGGEPGSGLSREVLQAIEAYDLDLELVSGSTPASIAMLQNALAREQPVVVTLWEPSWMMQKFPVRFLKDPKGIFAPPQSYYYIAHEGFSAEKPEAREILAGIYLPLEQITAINGDVKDGKTMEQAVADWLASNDALVKLWENVGTDKYQ